jgi:TetR/AcrR family transcriptional regulator, transcriptional repressor for nem operon
MPVTAPSADTRTRLVLAAMQLFWEKGYGSTSVADVLKSAAVNSGSLYHFFPGKQELLLAVLDAYLGGIGPMLLEPAWRGVEDPIERIFALLARYRRSLTDTECFYGCPIGSLALELHEPDPAVRERLAANFSAWVDAIHECLVAAGTRLPRELDRRALAQFVLTTMEGGVMLARTFRDIGHFDAAICQLRSHFDHLAGEALPAGSARRRNPRKTKERK